MVKSMPDAFDEGNNVAVPATSSVIPSETERDVLVVRSRHLKSSPLKMGARAGKPARRALVNRAACGVSACGFDPWRIPRLCRQTYGV